VDASAAARNDTLPMPIDVLARAGAPLWLSGLLGLLLFALSAAITLVRSRRGRWTGTPDDPADLLTKLVRTQANTAQYVAFLALAIVVLGAGTPAPWVRAAMGLAVVSRYLFAIGMLMSARIDRFNPVRAVGAGGTYLAGFALCLALLLGRD